MQRPAHTLERSVLWIDDDLSRVQRYLGPLSERGIGLFVTSSIADARDLLQRQDHSIQAVLVDIALSSGQSESLSGLNARAFLNAITDVPVVGVSSQWDRVDALDSLPVLTHLLNPEARLELAIHQIDLITTHGANRERESPREGPVSPSVLTLPTFDLELYRKLVDHPDLLKTLHWRTFESLLNDCLATMGYTVELQRGTKDGGIDIFAIRRDTVLGPHRYLLQAKRYGNSVGVAPVREVLFLHDHHRVSKSCLATTSRFTRGAWKLAGQYPWQLALRDQDGLHDWIKEVMRLKSAAAGIE